MIVTFTDFGVAGPYLGQMRAALHRLAPGVPVVDLFADAPAFDPYRSAYLLAAYCGNLPVDAVFLCVVDPGVGGARDPVALRLDGRWFVGPDNGLFAMIARRAKACEAFRIDPKTTPGVASPLSASFHGRDLFAPAAAALVCGATPQWPAIETKAIDRPAWTDDLAEIVYIDVYGNAMTGLRAVKTPANARLRVAGGHPIHAARVFADAAPGRPFWYVNSNGLVEIATPSARADRRLGVTIGATVTIITE